MRSTQIAPCRACGKRAGRFLVQHAETAQHWRCLECMRSLGLPFLVLGWQTYTDRRAMDADESRGFAAALREAWREYLLRFSPEHRRRLRWRPGGN